MTQNNDKRPDSRPDYRIAPIPFSEELRVAGLSNRKPNRFDLAPDAAMRAQIAQYLGINAIAKLRLTGEIRPKGRHDFTLHAMLEASAEQACSITLAPVVTEIKEEVLRVFLADWKETEGEEMQMPEDDSMEALGEVIDLGHVTVEALSLALPAFPRAPGAVLEDAQFAAPGTTPLRDGDLKPFAGLAGLKAKLEQGKEPDNDDDDENEA
ncbi:YceD family protein [Pseudorhodobacter aquimaris]|uniref:YceD family protein n=1 Tax=Pseudorhodobacter aquimaris TaxID=687412 RepID=UPI00067DE284|nr:DUF177 domain-containing protein [Pseudorhodobacter aquimaris]